MTTSKQSRSLQLLAVATLLLGLLPALGASGAANRHGIAFHPLAKRAGMVQQSPTPPTDEQCRASRGLPCYSPQEIRNAYNITPLLNAGYRGKGQTIVIIDSFGSPTLANDLKVFDAGYGLPDPPSLKQEAPLGSVPFDPNNDEQAGWAFETTLDVEWAHAIAPEANILVLTSPIAETQGVQGLPEFLFLEKYAVDQHLGNIISQSWGTTENTLFDQPGKFTLSQFEDFYKYAAQKQVSVYASSGDDGTANPDVNGNIYPFPTVGYPASSPYVTAVGGTSLYADTKGNYQSEVVWNNRTKGGATGGGVSQYFKEPSYQKGLPSTIQKQLNGHRGLPDISYNADPYTSILVYLSFLGPKNAGYYRIGGTSEGAPQWAGISALANQYAHRPLGFLNPALYKLGYNKGENQKVYYDILVGDNAFAGIPGYSAGPGWDATTGWGSPKVTQLVKELAEYK